VAKKQVALRNCTTHRATHLARGASPSLVRRKENCLPPKLNRTHGSMTVIKIGKSTVYSNGRFVAYP
jgi:hypothetical protein